MKRKAFSILYRLPQDTEDNIELYRTSNEQTETGIVKYWGNLESLRALVDIKSMSPVGIPEGIDDLGTIEKMEAFKSFQWEAQRIHMEVRRSKDWGAFRTIAEVALVPRDPHYTINLRKLITDQVISRFAYGDRLGVRLIDAGFGLLTDIDNVTIFGEGIEEAFSEEAY